MDPIDLHCLDTSCLLYEKAKQLKANFLVKILFSDLRNTIINLNEFCKNQLNNLYVSFDILDVGDCYSSCSLYFSSEPIPHDVLIKRKGMDRFFYIHTSPRELLNDEYRYLDELEWDDSDDIVEDLDDIFYQLYVLWQNNNFKYLMEEILECEKPINEYLKKDEENMKLFISDNGKTTVLI